MTLNEWEQSNIEVLTSREMGEWLGRRENRLLDKIRAEIEEYKSRQLTLAIGVKDLEYGKQIALEYVLAIIDKYMADL